ncbi:MAG: mandelate racemase/muconate lactonizing enzyme family protein [Candidatus Latescibacterota bacterium]|nr:mandelate racemase/muconate lactonizing enzyme family protein [Candidatus Latescibacterota bacterium]
MRLVDVKAVYPNYNHATKTWRTHFWQIVVRVETDCGVIGWGYGGGGVAAVEVINKHFREIIIGKSVDSVEDISALWELLYIASVPYGRGGLALMALSGLDLAVWDALARAESKSTCELLGGVARNRVKGYATSQDPMRSRDDGFTAYKFTHLAGKKENTNLDQLIANVRSARDVFGNDALLMVDAYMSWDVKYALDAAKGLLDFGVYWFEDVLSPDDLSELARLKSELFPVKLVGGEHDFTRHAFGHIARADSLDIWQPDITWCGGLTELLRISELASSYKIPVCPHRGGEVWGLHFLSAGYGMDLAECHVAHFRQDGPCLWLHEPVPEGGYLQIGDGIGFGVEPNEALL